ncbi:MAG: hypothetical protein GX606_01355 [Elusimicrobia bacterium]|nr:hypothetical protein [Elusimicrobiota bacterium]
MCDLPEGSVLLASSPGCPVQAFRVGERAYGLQFHAEITGKSIEEWSAAYAPEDALGRQVMLRHYQRVKSVFDGYGQTLCENFLRIVKGK